MYLLWTNWSLLYLHATVENEKDWGMGPFYLNMHTSVCLHMYICVWCCSACRNIYTSTRKHTHTHTHTHAHVCARTIPAKSSTPSPDHTLIIKKNSKTPKNTGLFRKCTFVASHAGISWMQDVFSNDPNKKNRELCRKCTFVTSHAAIPAKSTRPETAPGLVAAGNV